ncbi:MAG: carbamoyltransferase HypF [Acidobacteria bacterium]|nr:carbamoyltransferase HypF [Acidobacteriota bacterium]
MKLKQRLRIRVVGIVQGVGFRPFVARLAEDLGLSGFVRNTTSAVVIEVESSPDLLASFLKRLETELPASATIEHLNVETIDPVDDQQFQILTSGTGESHSAGLPPDLAICRDCCREMDSPEDRRYRYPFLNCTACGPRYSIVEGLPYDRPLTTMRDFALCPDCRAEYEDHKNRRYHAQPIACPVCGPKLWFERADFIGDSDAIELALTALSEGQIGAIRGIGGFHLACDARNTKAVAVLRARKARGDQPFALMVRDIETAREFVQIDEQAAALLGSTAAPIVLLQKSGDSKVGNDLAPSNGYIGVMLPYSPLHRLLMKSLDALVMTSGNLHGEPIVTGNEEAVEKLSLQADFFLHHNRGIAAACDDSVVRLYRGRALAIRRGRGYAPISLSLPVDCISTLAVGADLKSAFCLGRGGKAYPSPHIGDMENLATLESFERSLHHLSRLYQFQPEQVVYDAHPGYLSTQWALRFADEHHLPALAIQHHRAHAASVMAEYGLTPDQKVVAVVFDGTGFGDDGAIWGGEFFSGDLTRLQRTMHLPYVELPGGDASARRPALAAIAHLHAAGLDWTATKPACALTALEAKLLPRQLGIGLNCHRSSSMGRLFDAAASILDIRHSVAFEAQAAIEMEALAARSNDKASYAVSRWNLAELWAEMLTDTHATTEAKAQRFHQTISLWTSRTAQELALAEGTDTIVLSGGVFQNLLLLECVSSTLEQAGFRVLVPRYLPPNDGGLALGQLYLGALADPR